MHIFACTEKVIEAMYIYSTQSGLCENCFTQKDFFAWKSMSWKGIELQRQKSSLAVILPDTPCVRHVDVPSWNMNVVNKVVRGTCTIGKSSNGFAKTTIRGLQVLPVHWTMYHVRASKKTCQGCLPGIATRKGLWHSLLVNYWLCSHEYVFPYGCDPSPLIHTVAISMLLDPGEHGR